MIYTVTLNPCVDLTYVVDSLSRNRMNRSVKSRMDYCGKGVNVSITLSVLGTKSVATGFFGEADRAAYQKVFDRYTIQNRVFYREGATRINTKIVDLSTKEQTDVSESGTPVPKVKIKELEDFLRENVTVGDIVVFSGSVPPEFDFDHFCALCDIVTYQNGRLVVDSERERLAYAIKSHAFLIKPNIHEFEDYLSKKLSSREDVVREAIAVAKAGISNVVISMGGGGCVFANARTALYAPAIDVPVVSTTGAGDAVVAGFLHAFSSGHGFEDCAKSAMASSNACVMSEGTLPPDRDEYDRLLKRVRLQRIV